MPPFKTYSVIFYLSFLVLFGSCTPKAIETGKVYIAMEEFDKAVIQLNKAAEEYPYDPEVYFLMGKAYSKLGDIVKMAESFNKSLKWGPKYYSEIEKIIRPFNKKIVNNQIE